MPEFTQYETIAGGALIFWVLMTSKGWPLKSAMWFLPPLLFSLLLLIQSIEFSNSFTDFIRVPFSWFSIHLLFMVLALSPKRKELFMLVGIGMFCGLLVNVLEYFQWIDLFGLAKEKSRFGGTLVNPNGYSFIAVSVLMWGLMYREKLRFWPIILIVCIHIIWVQSLSRTYMVVSLLALSSLIPILSWRKWVIGLILTFVIVLASNLDFTRTIERFNTIGDSKADLSTVHRIRYIEAAIEYWRVKPLFGWGTDAFRHINSSSYSHNNYTEVLCNHGLFGFMIYYSFHALIFIIALIRRNVLVLVALFTILLSDIGIVSMIEKSAWFIHYLGISVLIDYENERRHNRNR